MSRDTRIAALCLASLALIILGSSLSATFALAHGATHMLRWPFRLLCHGIAHRCLTVFDTPMPICARCFGIYSGFIAALLLFPIFRSANERLLRITLAVVALPMFLDGITQAFGLRESTNPLRLATGLTLGAAFGLWVLVSIETRARQRLAAS